MRQTKIDIFKLLLFLIEFEMGKPNNNDHDVNEDNEGNEDYDDNFIINIEAGKAKKNCHDDRIYRFEHILEVSQDNKWFVATKEGITYLVQRDSEDINSRTGKIVWMYGGIASGVYFKSFVHRGEILMSCVEMVFQGADKTFWIDMDEIWFGNVRWDEVPIHR